MKDIELLSSIHLDVLREIGNIGSGNAATALAQMLDRKIDMSVPWVGIVHLKDIVGLVGNDEELVACVSFSVAGPAPVRLLFLLPADSVFLLIDMLLGRDSGTTTKIGDLEESTLRETGNILSGSFLNAFAALTQLSFITSLPYLAFDMLGAVLNSAIIEGGCHGDQILIIETNFTNEQGSINSHFFLLPEAGSLKIIMEAMGIILEEEEK